MLCSEHQALRDSYTKGLGEVECQEVLRSCVLLHMLEPGVPGLAMKRVRLAELGRNLALQHILYLSPGCEEDP